MNAPDGFRASWLSQLSHDLRNQLSPVRTATQLLQIGRLEPERQAEMLEMIERQVQRMVGMLDDVAEYGRLGARPPTPEHLHLDYLIDSALGECGQRLRAAGHRFELQLPDARLPITGDRGRLVHMFLRLLDNAIRFTPDGGRIVVSARARRIRGNLDPRQRRGAGRRSPGKHLPPARKPALVRRPRHQPVAGARLRRGTRGLPGSAFRRSGTGFRIRGAAAAGAMTQAESSAVQRA